MDKTTGTSEAWQKAFLAADWDAVADLYEDDAIFVMPSMEIVAEGRDEIRAAWEGLGALGEALSVDLIGRDEVIDGNHAYAHQHGVIKMRGPDGEEGDVPFRTTEVLHRGDDGTWRYIIDHA